MWVIDFPEGNGYVHLGPDYRAFYLAMWHELHCMRMINLFFDDPDNTFGGEEHFHHCLNYLRQSVMCIADTHLEHNKVDPYVLSSLVGVFGP